MTQTATATEQASGSTASAADPPRSSPSIARLLGELLRDLPGLFSDRVHLFGLELKRARRALIGIAAMLMLTAILAVTAWISLWVLVVAAAMRYGVAWDVACIFVLLANIVATWLAIRHASKLAGYLSLPATMRQLAGAPARAAEAAEQTGAKTMNPTDHYPHPPPPANEG